MGEKLSRYSVNAPHGWRNAPHLAVTVLVTMRWSAPHGKQWFSLGRGELLEVYGVIGL